MLEGFKLYDADAHVLMAPEMWRDLPGEYALRRPRPVAFGDSADLAQWRTAWLLDGRVEPHPYGPGTHAANTPRMAMVEYGAKPDDAGDIDSVGMSIGCVTLGDPPARLKAMDGMGIDVQMMFPSTLYATMTTDPGFEAALFRCYNRYMAERCRHAPRRLKWAGLLPMRDQKLGIETLEEIVKLGASAIVVFGTVGERMHSNESFRAIWDAVAASKLPVCVHMAMSFPSFEPISHSILDANMIGKAIPAQLAFVALVGHKMMERYSNMKIGFLEFGGEWIFYSVGRMTHYIEINRRRVIDPKTLPTHTPLAIARSGRLFLSVESSDAMMAQEFELLGDGQLLYSSDFPHGEGRDNAAQEIIVREDISRDQKRKILYDNAASFFGPA